jgi:hypothetical protein
VTAPDNAKSVWRNAAGDIVACVEKNKVMQENLDEVRQICQDALDDAVLMGCDASQVRTVLLEMIRGLEAAFLPRT